MSASLSGIPRTDAHKARISATLTGRKRDPAATEKQAAKMRGQKRTKNQREKIRDAHCLRNGTKPIEAFGRSQFINDWAREFGVNAGTLRNRLKRAGMTLEDALMAPNHRGRRNDIRGTPDLMRAA